MGKPKQTQENAELEQQLRSMILGNVRIGPSTPTQAPSNTSSHSNPRGSSQYVPPHLRNNFSQTNSPVMSPGFNNSPVATQQPLSPPASNIPPTGPRHQGRQPNRPYGYHQTQQGPQHARNHSNQSFPSQGISAPIATSPVINAPNGNPKVLRRPPGLQQAPQSSIGSNMTNGPPQRIRQPPNAPPMAAFVAQCEHLDQIAAAEIPLVEMLEEEFVAKEEFRAQLEVVAQAALESTFPDLGSTLRLRCYGSLASGFATKGSDVDLTIVWDGPTPEDPVFVAELPRILEKGILDAGYGARLLSRTRVPIVKICEKPSAELFSALKEERQNWDSSSHEEKYPSLAPQSPLPETGSEPPSAKKTRTSDKNAKESQAIDPDVSRSGKVMQSEKPVMAKEGTLAFLEQLKAMDRSHLENLNTYCARFINTASKLLRNRQIDDSTAAQYFLEGLPSAVSTEVTSVVEAALDKASLPLFDRYYDAAMLIIAARNKPKPRTEKPWLREKMLGPLDFPKTGVGIQCDINFSNALAIHNTQLLRCYYLCDPRVRLMVLFVKAWAKRRKINSAYSGTLSSYGYVLMVLHFLVNVAKPPVVPNLQHAFGANNREIMAHGYNISFWSDEGHIRHLAAQKQLTQNTEPLGVLLRNFFHYFAAQGPQVIGGGFNWMKDVISIRTPMGILSKEGKEWTGAKTVTIDNREVRQRYLFAIEDPFELDHNVARPVTHNGIVTIRDEFRRVWRILQFVGNSSKPEGGLFDMIQEVAVKPAGNGPAQQDGAEGKENGKAEAPVDRATETQPAAA
jgi:terminal uridylyltransferase